MSPVALIFGISGQDGSLLANRLLAGGYIVNGASRDAELNEFTNLTRLGIRDRVQLFSANPTDFRSVTQVIERTRPDEVYNLSGQSSVGLSFAEPLATMESIAIATLNMLEAIRLLRIPARFYNAASSECFGDTGAMAADELTSFRPRSPYGIAKAAAYWTVAHYREAYGLFAASGILFNHESPLRPERFVTQKIVRGAVRIAMGEYKEPLQLGDLSISRDWGWAPEYIEAVRLIMRNNEPEDFIVATGESRTLKEFTALTFAEVGLDWQEFVVSKPELVRPSDIAVSASRPDRVRERLGWAAKTRMDGVVKRLVAAERLRVAGQPDVSWWKA